MNEQLQPTSWKDVYALVRDTRTDVLDAVKTVDGKVDSLDRRFSDHLINHAPTTVVVTERRAEKWGAVKTVIQLILPVPTFLLALAAVMGYKLH